MSKSDFFIRETTHLSIAQMAEATNATFAGYFTPITHTASGFAMFCRWNSVDLAHSVLMEHRDGRLAGLSVLAMRGERGWCGGFGIVPEFRGQGLSSTLVNALMGRACGLSLATLQLEVLTQNAPAIRTYERAGFEAGRELVILSGDIGKVEVSADSGLHITPAETPAEAWTAGLGLPSPSPCWQRDVVSLLSMNDVRGVVARHGRRVVGVLLYRLSPPPGVLSLVHLVFEEEAAARALLAYALAEARTTQVFLLNEPENSPLSIVLKSLGLRELHRQHEMTAVL